jgi:hypothetical protein
MKTLNVKEEDSINGPSLKELSAKMIVKKRKTSFVCLSTALDVV